MGDCRLFLRKKHCDYLRITCLIANGKNTKGLFLRVFLPLWRTLCNLANGPLRYQDHISLPFVLPHTPVTKVLVYRNPIGQCHLPEQFTSGIVRCISMAVFVPLPETEVDFYRKSESRIKMATANVNKIIHIVYTFLHSSYWNGNYFTNCNFVEFDESRFFQASLYM